MSIQGGFIIGICAITEKIHGICTIIRRNYRHLPWHDHKEELVTRRVPKL